MKRFLFLFLCTGLVWSSGFTPDNRQPAPKADPYRALCRVTAAGGVGCGFMVGPDWMLTCAHVVSDEKRKVHPDVEVELGVGLGNPTTHKAHVREVKFSEQTNGDVSSGQDWALVQLDKPLGLLYGWAPCHQLNDSELKDLKVELVGFCDCPEEARPELGEMIHPYTSLGQIRDVGKEILFHDCAMWSGSSGSVLLAKFNDRLEIVAVNSAAVTVEGEKLNHGFRNSYVKELANIAVPARQWEAGLAAVSVKRGEQAPSLRTFWVRNRSLEPLTVRLRYRSLFADPKDPYVVTLPQVVPSQKRTCLLVPDQGCADSEIFISLENPKGERVGPKQFLEFTDQGEKRLFFRKFLGGSSDYTAILP